jgi:hypothetical protein
MNSNRSRGINVDVNKDEAEGEYTFNEMVKSWSLQEKYERERWDTIDKLEDLMGSVMTLAESICKLVSSIKKSIKE